MIRGIHVLILGAIALAGVAVRATEVYTSRYQTLPVQDWVESRPPLAESTRLPAAADLARGLSRAMPLLVIRNDAFPHLPAFSPPSSVQRTMGGVRDAARIEMGSPGNYLAGQVPITARLDVIVFNRVERAAAWSELMRRAMDVRDPESALPHVRMTGPDDPFMVWLPVPHWDGGIVNVAGYRGPVGYELEVRFLHASDADAAQLADVSARAETLARQAATDWTDWLDGQLAA